MNHQKHEPYDEINMDKPTPSATTPRSLLTETEAAQILKFSVRTLQNWRCRGGGPRFVKVSRGCIRYRLEDLDAWVESCLRWSTSDEGSGAAGSAAPEV